MLLCVYDPLECKMFAPPIKRWRPVTSFHQKNVAKETVQVLGHKRHCSFNSHTFGTWRSPSWKNLV